MIKAVCDRDSFILLLNDKHKEKMFILCKWASCSFNHPDAVGRELADLIGGK